jgi:hypothetical protein
MANQVIYKDGKANIASKNNMYFGYLMWCDCEHYYEPEGTIWWDDKPEVGDRWICCSGFTWEIIKVGAELEAWSKRVL